MSVAAEHLVGRAGELGAFDTALDELAGGRSLAGALTGEPGIGKTRLLAELGGKAGPRGCLVLTGSASELEQELPFWMFVDALDDYVHGLDQSRLDVLAPAVRERLAHVLPSLAGYRADAAPRDERYLTHVAVRDLLELL